MKIILTFFLICFANYGLSQEEEFNDDVEYLDIFEEQEDIACENLPEAFKKYNEDRNLNQAAMERSLSHTIKTLKDISKRNSKSKGNLSELIDKLEEAVILSESNSLTFLNKSDNISYFLKDCISKETNPDTKNK